MADLLPGRMLVPILPKLAPIAGDIFGIPRGAPLIALDGRRVLLRVAFLAILAIVLEIGLVLGDVFLVRLQIAGVLPKFPLVVSDVLREG